MVFAAARKWLVGAGYLTEAETMRMGGFFIKEKMNEVYEGGWEAFCKVFE